MKIKKKINIKIMLIEQHIIKMHTHLKHTNGTSF